MWGGGMVSIAQSSAGRGRISKHHACFCPYATPVPLVAEAAVAALPCAECGAAGSSSSGAPLAPSLCLCQQQQWEQDSSAEWTSSSY